MHSFGHVTTKIISKEVPCKYCEQVIEKGSLYVRIIGERGRGIFPTKKNDTTPRSIKVWVFSYHNDCWLKVFEEENNSQIDLYTRRKNHEPGLRKTLLSKLTPEQRERRRILQTYITTRDIPALINAYERQSTSRVYIVMNTIANRWQELSEMGVPFQHTLTSKSNNENDIKLKKLILKYDSRWMFNVWDRKDITLEEEIEALRRNSSDKYPPTWDTKVVETETSEPEHTPEQIEFNKMIEAKLKPIEWGPEYRAQVQENLRISAARLQEGQEE